MAYQVLIDDETIELERGAVVPVTRQINDIAEMVDRQGDYSARLRAVLSNRNKKIFGFTDNPNSVEDKAYQLPTGRIRGSGGTIIEDGFARVLSVSDAIEFMINGPGFNFWQTIAGLDLHDLDWSDLDLVLNATNVGATASKITGMIFPVVDYYDYTTVGGSLDLRYTPGSIYFHECVRRIIEEQGYTLEGDILNDTLYKALLLPFSGNKWQHSKRYEDERSVNKSLYQAQSFADFSNVSVSNKTAAQVTFADGNTFNAIDTSTLSLAITYNVSSYTETVASGGSLDIKLVIRKNAIIEATEFITGTGAGTFTASIPVVYGDEIDVYVVADYSIVSGVSSYQIIFDSLNFYTDEIDLTIDIGDTLTPESILPKMNQKTFIKSFLHLFALIPVVNDADKTVSFHRFDEIYDNIPAAKDWSNKVVKPENRENWYDAKETRLGNYGQINYFSWASDDTLDNPDYGEGTIEVNDLSLEKEYTVFTLPFAASESSQVPVNLQRVPVIPFYTSDGAGGYEQTKEPTQRLIYVTRPGVAFSYYDGTTSVANGAAVSPWGKFIDPEQTANLGFNNNLLTKYYGGLQKMLTQSKRFTVLMNLTAADVSTHDFFTPVYLKQFGGVFYINKFSNFIEGKLTSVPVVRL